MDCAQEDEGGDSFVSLFAARRDASDLFEIAEEILDEMPPTIHGEVTGYNALAIRFRRDDGLGFGLAEQFTQTVVVQPPSSASMVTVLSAPRSNWVDVVRLVTQHRLITRPSIR